MKQPFSTHQFWRPMGIFLDTFLFHNLVLVQAVGLCPIIAAGVNLKYGVTLTVCTLAALLPTSLLMSVLGDRLSAWLRPPVYTVTAAILLLAASFLIDRFVSTELYASLYVFLPLMAVNSIVTYRAGGFSVQNRPSAALVDALGSALGFGVVICVVSALREMATNNTLWDVPLPFSVSLPEAALPFAAFIMLGFMAAFLQWLKTTAGAVRARKKGEEAA